MPSAKWDGLTQKRLCQNDAVVMNLVINIRKAAKGRPDSIGICAVCQKLQFNAPQEATGLFLTDRWGKGLDGGGRGRRDAHPGKSGRLGEGTCSPVTPANSSLARVGMALASKGRFGIFNPLNKGIPSLSSCSLGSPGTLVAEGMLSWLPCTQPMAHSHVGPTHG